MTKLFDLPYIENELHKINAHLNQPITMYVIGGGAMAHHGIKTGTKDIDVILHTGQEADALSAALKATGYTTPSVMTDAYTNMGARQVLENRDEFRWDIFVRNVLGFHFSNRMAHRTQPWMALSNLRATILDLEDIFTFKSLTTRDRDRDDMNTIFLQGIDMDIVHDEVRQQAREESGKSFPAAFRVGMEEFVKTFGIIYTLPRDIEDLAYHAHLVHALSILEPEAVHTLAALASKYGCTRAELENAAQTAERFGHITRHGPTIKKRNATPHLTDA